MRSHFANIHIDVFCFPSIHASHFAHCAGGVISSLYEGQLVTLAQVQVEETAAGISVGETYVQTTLW